MTNDSYIQYDADADADAVAAAAADDDDLVCVTWLLSFPVLSEVPFHLKKRDKNQSSKYRIFMALISH